MGEEAGGGGGVRSPKMAQINFFPPSVIFNFSDYEIWFQGTPTPSSFDGCQPF